VDVRSRSDGGERGGENLTGEIRFPARSLRVVNGGVDAELLATNGGDDGLQRTTMISKVVVAGRMG
jgi:hypothetical protein